MTPGLLHCPVDCCVHPARQFLLAFGVKEGAVPVLASLETVDASNPHLEEELLEVCDDA